MSDFVEDLAPAPAPVCAEDSIEVKVRQWTYEAVEKAVQELLPPLAERIIREKLAELLRESESEPIVANL